MARDVAGVDLLDLLALVGVHAQDAADALVVAVVAEHDRVAGLEHAGVDAEEDQLADERVGLDLEHQRRERLLVVGLALDELLRVEDVVALSGRHVQRRRQVVADRVEHGLHALVLIRGAAEHGENLALQDALAQGLPQLVGR